LERFIERDQILVSVGRNRDGIVERELDDVSASALIAASARRVDEDAAHCAGGDGEKVRAIVPADLRDVDEAQVGLVDECRRLERVAATLASHVVAREAVQLGVDERNQSIECILIAAAPGQQKRRRCGQVGGDGAYLTAPSRPRCTKPCPVCAFASGEAEMAVVTAAWVLGAAMVSTGDAAAAPPAHLQLAGRARVFAEAVVTAALHSQESPSC